MPFIQAVAPCIRPAFALGYSCRAPVSCQVNPNLSFSYPAHIPATHSCCFFCPPKAIKVFRKPSVYVPSSLCLGFLFYLGTSSNNPSCMRRSLSSTAPPREISSSVLSPQHLGVFLYGSTCNIVSKLFILGAPG